MSATRLSQADIFLLRHLDVRSAADAIAIVRRYFDEDHLPAKTRLALEELLGR